MASSVGTLLMNENNRLFRDPPLLTRRIRCKESLNRARRTVYFSGVVGVVIFDYWKSFRNLTEGTAEYKETEHIVNARNAQRIYRLCE